MSALKGKANMLRVPQSAFGGKAAAYRHYRADAVGRAVSDDYLKSISIPISPGFPQATAPWITGALVQTPDIMAVEALPLSPASMHQACGWPLLRCQSDDN
jgi:hypothetical protein